MSWQKLPRFFEDIFGRERIDAMPVIAVENGSTDYLDRIRPEEVTAAFVKGIDPFSRRFVAFKVQNKAGEVAVYCMFERYTACDTIVMCESHRSASHNVDFHIAIGACTHVGVGEAARLRDFVAASDKGEAWKGMAGNSREEREDAYIIFVER